LYASKNIIRVLKSWRMGWVGCVELMGEIINAYKVFVGRPQGKRRLGSIDIDERITLMWVLEK
jgi:hypothetical protein